MLESIQSGPPDPIYFLKKKADEDPSPRKVDLGVGIYRDETGKYQEFESIKKESSAKVHYQKDNTLTLVRLWAC